MSYSRGKKIKFNKNEKLTIDWVIEQSVYGKPIITDNILSTINQRGLKKVMKKLEKSEILTFTDFKTNMVVFINKNNKMLNIVEGGNWRSGYVQYEGGNIMVLTPTPLF